MDFPVFQQDHAFLLHEPHIFGAETGKDAAVLLGPAP